MYDFVQFMNVVSMSNLVAAVCGYGWRAKNFVSSLFVSLCKVGILLYALISAVSLIVKL